MRIYSYKPKIGAPDIPRNISITSVTDTTITIAWLANTESDFSSYNLYRSIDGITYGLPYVTGLTSSVYQDTELTPSTLYYYKITCEDTSGNESGFSSVISQETTAPVIGLTWSQNLPNPISFTYGQASTFDLDPYIAGTPGSITVETGALPPNVTIVNQTLSYDGGGSSFGHTETGVSFRISSTAADDWQSRISGAGVVWYHDFDNDAEVEQFKYITGDGYNITSAHPTHSWQRRGVGLGVHGGHCLEIYRACGGDTSEPPAWRRPMCPITGAGNGRGVDDPAANGTLTKRTWNSNNSEGISWDVGWYGHSDYNTSSAWDGTEYWVQFRVRLDPARFQGGNEDYDGKLCYPGVNWVTAVNDYLVQCRGDQSFGMYTAFGSGILEKLYEPQDYSSTPLNQVVVQPGWNSNSCTYPRDPSKCFYWTSGIWYTMMMHVTPGHFVADNWGPADHGVEVWLQELDANGAVVPGNSPFQVWSKSNYQMYPTPNKRFGWNEWQFSCYHNGQAMPGPSFVHRYDQLIFSKQFIPWPQV